MDALQYARSYVLAFDGNCPIDIVGMLYTVGSW